MKKLFLLISLAASFFVACKSAQTTSTDVSIADEHKYVDLGLSVKWATCNVGATNPEEFGDYFAWGEVKTKEKYNWENSIIPANTIIIEHVCGHVQYDAARALWGDGWRMPTGDEVQELLDNCHYEYTLYNGVYGGLFTSKKNGNSIFLPAAGSRCDETFRAGVEGYYWYDPMWDDGVIDYVEILVISHSMGLASDHRFFGQSIRPVIE